MDEADARKIFEEIQYLKKEYEKLKEENEQLKRLLKENSIIMPSEVVPQYSERKQMLNVANFDDTQTDDTESIDLEIRDDFYIEESKIDKNSDLTESHNNFMSINEEAEFSEDDFEDDGLNLDSIMKRKAERKSKAPNKSYSKSASATEIIGDRLTPSYNVSHQEFTDKKKELEEISKPITTKNERRKDILQDLLGDYEDNESNINKNPEFEENLKERNLKADLNVNKSVKDFDELDDVSNNSLELDSILQKSQRAPVSTSKYERHKNSIQLQRSAPVNTRKEIIDNSLVRYKEEKGDMSIISFLARSNKRVQILKSLVESDKIPSIISKEIGDSNHHVSKYLKNLKEKGLVVCLNENDKRFRFYSITPKGKKYLKIMETKDY